MNKYILHIVLLLGSVVSIAQTAETEKKRTGLNHYKSSVITPSKIELDTAKRVYSQANTKYSNEEKVQQPVNFDFKYNPDTKLQPLAPKVTIYRLKINSEDHSKAGFVRAGLGNYASTLLDVYYGSKANKKFSYGIGYNHLASVNGNVNKKESGFSKNNIHLHTKYFLNKSTVDFSTSYRRQAVRNYGYKEATEKYGNLNTNSSANNVFTYSESLYLPSHQVNANLSIGNPDKEKLHYKLGVQPQYLKITDTLNNSGLLAYLEPSYQMKFGKIKLPVSWNLNQQTSSGQKYSRNLIDVSPSITHLSEDHRFNIEAGFKVNVSNDTSLNKNFSLYPLLKGSYVISENLKMIVHGELSGGINQYTLTDAYTENPFIKSAQLKSSNNKIAINSSLELSPLHDLNVKLGFNYSIIENLSFFTQDTLDLSFYTPNYSEKLTNVISPYIELDYSLKKGHKINLNTYLNSFSSQDDQTIYYTPTFRTELGFEYKLNKKLRISSDISYISGLIGYDPVNRMPDELDNILDINLKADFRVNKKLGLFLYGNNLLNKNYEFYRFYSVNGLNILGGVTYSF